MANAIHKFRVTNTQFVRIDSVDEDSSFSNYSMSVPVADIPEDIAGLMPDQINYVAGTPAKLFSLRTKFKPMIFGQDPSGEDLLPLRRFCEATGCTMSRLISGSPCEVAVVLFEKRENPRYDNHRPDRYGLGLEALRIDPGLIKLPTWESLTGGAI